MSGAVLAFDPATTTGWACALGQHVYYGRIATGQHDHGQRFDILQERAGLIMAAFEPQAIVYEQVSRWKAYSAAWAYGGFRGAILVAAHRGGHPKPSMVTTGEFKKSLGCAGNCGKDAGVAAVKALGYEAEDDNEADALGILNRALIEYGLSLNDFKPLHWTGTNIKTQRHLEGGI